MNAALDANDVERLLVVLRHPIFYLGTVDIDMARQYMISLKTFRTEHSGTFMDVQWTSITDIFQGIVSEKDIWIFFNDEHNKFRTCTQEYEYCRANSKRIALFFVKRK